MSTSAACECMRRATSVARRRPCDAFLRAFAFLNQRDAHVARSASDENVDLALVFDLLDELLKLLFALALDEEVLDLAAHFRERRGARWPPLVDLDDVKAELRLHDGADRAGLQPERGGFERRRHLPLRKESEIAAVGRASLILRLCPRERCEVGSG